jgi:predicted amidophosphoribosyltransferase
MSASSIVMPDNRARAGRRYGFNCGYCSSRLEATESMAAQDGQCPTCGNQITIPILDRYNRLIDPKTRQIIKQDPHPVHAYAAAGERAPGIRRKPDGQQVIVCSRCSAVSPITANNCKQCGMPFTMEGTTLEASGANNGFCVASLVLGILGLLTFCAYVIPPLAVIFGIIGLMQTTRQDATPGRGRNLAIAGLILGLIGSGLSFLKLMGWI